ncbi:sulfate transporter CysZ [Candidatus Vondammii sp. HM_W22]|uniref:sulfate transporter CysZ n=1 Tax=Candidatus Vondammii sp. HM_W22 TaxID=2687299 RepID=UPI001F143666|nr:sulfate transporter CysZ [Candidatus Vondammii sp. HM_W22]
MNNNPLLGFNYLLKGFRMLQQPGLKRHILVPLLINIIVFSLVGWAGYSYFDAFLNSLLPESSMFSFLRWILWPLFALAGVLITFYTFTAIANLIAAPFNSLLSAKVEQMVTGKMPPENQQGLSKIILPTILSELRKLSYFLIRALPLLLLFIIPVVNIAAPFLWLLFSAWFLALEYGDYPMGNHGLRFSEQHNRMKQVRFTAMGFGGGVTLLLLIPLLNFAAMPAAVVGATLFWCEKRESLEAPEFS